ncbi:MFS transporter [Kocuria koreensis]|jgi:MFS family permease|uniref:MFS transporter n=1 Tax=Rothia koreensis TaxID=592378 RepID=A0A7K1LK97_9MICC|nr:MFS transporter [Rothia koreensis]MUN55616.1 MFS transporter [Rothia koreensis]
MLRPIFWPVIVPSLLFAIGVGSTVPVLILSALSLGAGGALASAVVSLMGAASLILTVPVGVLIDKVGDRRAMIFGTGAAVVVTGLLVLSLSGSLPDPFALVMYIVLLMLLAPVQDIWSLARQAVVADKMPAMHMGKAMTALGGTQRVGNLVGPMISAMLLLWFPLWSVYVFSAMCAVLAVVVLCIPALNRGFDAMESTSTATTPTAALADPNEPAPRKLQVRWKAVLLAGIAVTILSIARAAQPTLIQLWGVHIHLHESGISLLVALGAALELVLMFPGGYIKDRLGRTAVLIVCLVVFGGGFLIMSIQPVLVWTIIAVVVMAVGNGLGAGVNMTIGADLSPKVGRAKFLGIWAVFNNSGKLGGPAIVALLLSLASLPLAVVATGVLTILGAVWAGVFARPMDLPKGIQKRKA